MTTPDTMADPAMVGGIVGEITRELMGMHYSLPTEDAERMAERAYIRSERHIIGRMEEILAVVPDASLKGTLEFWKVLGHAG